MRPAPLALALTCALASACLSSRYQPRAPGRVAVVMKHGQRGYVRDGKFHSAGFFGSGLADAVAGDPEAARVARRYHDRSSEGFWLALGGLLCTEGAAIYTALDAADDPEGHPSTTGIVVLVGCAVLGVYGSWELFDAIPDELDAINIFNDHAALRALPPVGPVAPVAPIAPIPGPRLPGQVRP